MGFWSSSFLNFSNPRFFFFSFIRLLLVPLLLWVIFLGGCQFPTGTSSSSFGRAFPRDKADVSLDLNKFVVLDTRSLFEYEMSPWPRSFHVNPVDWDLSSYHGEALEEKRRSLQRLLALKGVAPDTNVLILGHGLKGRGEEFLLATTLLNLGVRKFKWLVVDLDTFKSLFGGRASPRASDEFQPLENLPFWTHPVVYDFRCPANSSPHILILKEKSNTPTTWEFTTEELFSPSLRTLPKALPKPMILHIRSPKTYWEYGLALHIRESRGGRPCVID